MKFDDLTDANLQRSVLVFLGDEDRIGRAGIFVDFKVSAMDGLARVRFQDDSEGEFDPAFVEFVK